MTKFKFISSFILFIVFPAIQTAPRIATWISDKDFNEFPKGSCVVTFQVIPEHRYEFIRPLLRINERVKVSSVTECAYSCYKNACSSAVFQLPLPGEKGANCLMEIEQKELCSAGLQSHYLFKPWNNTIISCIRCRFGRPVTISRDAQFNINTTPLPFLPPQIQENNLQQIAAPVEPINKAEVTVPEKIINTPVESIKTEAILPEKVSNTPAEPIKPEAILPEKIAIMSVEPIKTKVIVPEKIANTSDIPETKVGTTIESSDTFEVSLNNSPDKVKISPDIIPASSGTENTTPVPVLQTTIVPNLLPKSESVNVASESRTTNSNSKDVDWAMFGAESTKKSEAVNIMENSDAGNNTNVASESRIVEEKSISLLDTNRTTSGTVQATPENPPLSTTTIVPEGILENSVLSDTNLTTTGTVNATPENPPLSTTTIVPDLLVKNEVVDAENNSNVASESSLGNSELSDTNLTTTGTVNATPENVPVMSTTTSPDLALKESANILQSLDVVPNTIQKPSEINIIKENPVTMDLNLATSATVNATSENTPLVSTTIVPELLVGNETSSNVASENTVKEIAVPTDTNLTTSGTVNSTPENLPLSPTTVNATPENLPISPTTAAPNLPLNSEGEGESAKILESLDAAPTSIQKASEVGIVNPVPSDTNLTTSGTLNTTPELNVLSTTVNSISLDSTKPTTPVMDLLLIDFLRWAKSRTENATTENLPLPTTILPVKSEDLTVETDPNLPLKGDGEGAKISESLDAVPTSIQKASEVGIVNPVPLDTNLTNVSNSTNIASESSTVNNIIDSTVSSVSKPNTLDTENASLRSTDSDRIETTPTTNLPLATTLDPEFLVKTVTDLDAENSTRVATSESNTMKANGTADTVTVESSTTIDTSALLKRENANILANLNAENYTNVILVARSANDSILTNNTSESVDSNVSDVALDQKSNAKREEKMNGTSVELSSSLDLQGAPSAAVEEKHQTPQKEQKVVPEKLKNAEASDLISLLKANLSGLDSSLNSTIQNQNITEIEPNLNLTLTQNVSVSEDPAFLLLKTSLNNTSNTLNGTMNSTLIHTEANLNLTNATSESMVMNVSVVALDHKNDTMRAEIINGTSVNVSSNVDQGNLTLGNNNNETSAKNGVEVALSIDSGMSNTEVEETQQKRELRPATNLFRGKEPIKLFKGCIVTFQAEPLEHRPENFTGRYEIEIRLPSIEMCARRCNQDGCTGALFEPQRKSCKLGFHEEYYCSKTAPIMSIRPCQWTPTQELWIHCVNCICKFVGK